MTMNYDHNFDVDGDGLPPMVNGTTKTHPHPPIAHNGAHHAQSNSDDCAADVNNNNNSDNGNGNDNYNHAKHDEWHDMGRFIHSSEGGNHDVAIERNSCMLEDLLATALDYDARMAAAAANETGHNEDYISGNDQHEINYRQHHEDEERQQNEHHHHQQQQQQQQVDVKPQLSQESNNITMATRSNVHDRLAPRQDNARAAITHGSTRVTASSEGSRMTPAKPPGGMTPASLPPSLRTQIRAYVARICRRYHRVGFHSFEHASHVMLSATKIVYMLQKRSPLHRVAEAASTEDGEEAARHASNANADGRLEIQSLAGTIYDPWLHFAIALSALLHDVDHKGVPNNELLAESDPLAKKYGSEECMKSYAEWNSVDIGLSLLRGCEEFREFAAVLEGRGGASHSKEWLYKMVTDLILCTDIASKERRDLGMQKWKRACDRGGGRQRRSSLSTVVTDNTSSAGVNATKGLLPLYSLEAARTISEQIMQVADVSHLMQHFSTFAKWNSHLYREVLAAHECGRTLAQRGAGGDAAEMKHPKENWYESQIGFYDNYIIPLAERLDSCGAFSEEDKFAPLAVQNKEAWILEGRACTRRMVEEAEGMSLLPPMPPALHADSVAESIDGADSMTESVEEEEGLLYAGERSGCEILSMSLTTVVRSGASRGGSKKREGESTPDGIGIEFIDESEREHSTNTPSGGDDDCDGCSLDSVPRSVDTAGRVSFLSGGSRISSMKAAAASSAPTRGSCSSSMSLGGGPHGEHMEREVDPSVDAVVPRILVRQVVDSLRRDVVSASRELRADALRESVSRYRSNGSIRRHRGALLFVDISGFTTLSQNYPVEDFKSFINRYFTKIIELVISFGGEVVKFAGDALYALWTTGGSDVDDGNCASVTSGSAGVGDGGRASAESIERCTLCAIAINSACNNYKVSKSYNARRRSESVDLRCSAAEASYRFSRRHTVVGTIGGRMQGEVLYDYQDKNAEYEERGAVLNVYCGVSEGIMAGVDVVSGDRAEFFLVGKPLKDVAKAEDLAGPGELVVSPSVYEYLQKSNLASKLVFTHVEGDFQRVSWPGHPAVVDMLARFKDRGEEIPGNFPDAQSLIDELVQNMHTTSTQCPLEVSESSSCNSSPPSFPMESHDLQLDVMRLLECHRHEAARDVVGKFTTELRRVVVLFVSIMYEPGLPRDPDEDAELLRNFQTIFSIISESVSSRSGQVRQFINDDKGTVFIASFGLRGSVVLHPSDRAVEAAKEAQQKLLDTMDIPCSIGITLGKIFCGETGSFERYEYSLLGPSVNLSARLMAKGAWGQIYCDEELRNHTSSRRHSFASGGMHKLKGYEKPVSFFVPASDMAEEREEEEGEEDILTFFMQKPEVLGLVEDILERRGGSQPRVIFVDGDEGRGKDAFISAMLKQPPLRSAFWIMEANRCYHDDPFYCFIPIVTRVLLSFPESRDRLVSLKKRRKDSSVLKSFLANDAFQTPAFPPGTAMVDDPQRPYLSLLNDFVFKGFPLLKSSLQVKRMKDNEKVEKCIEVLIALIVRFLELNEKPGIIFIREMNSIDSYSKKLLGRIVRSEANLLVIGGADSTSAPLHAEPSLSLDDCGARPSETQGRDTHAPDILTSILADEELSIADVEVEIRNLDLLDKESTFKLFRWSLRRELPHDDGELIDRPDVRDKIFQLTGGMVHATAQLAHTFGSRRKMDSGGAAAADFFDQLRTFLDDTPTGFEEVVCFRFDQMKPEEQVLLKIASVAGFDHYSFSQNLLETVLLATSRNERSVMTKAKDEHDDGSSGDDHELGVGVEVPVPASVGVDFPNSVGISEENEFNYMLQGDYFERTLDSLVDHKFLDEVNVEMSDLSSIDSVMYRFRNSHEQSIINGLMLSDQQKRTHFEVAAYYSSSFKQQHRDSLSGSGGGSGENEACSLSTDITMIPTTNWELFHIIALHYDLADVPILAMLHYYDSSLSLSSLGVRDQAHGRLLSAYLMLEKLLRHASTLHVKPDEDGERRRRIAGKMVQTIGNKYLKDSMKFLTKDHLRLAFSGDIFAFEKCLVMLTKFGQSVGVMESDGYLFGSEVYLQAILLVLLVLEDDVLHNLTSRLSSFLGQLDITKFVKVKDKNEIEQDDESLIDSSSFGSEEGAFFEDSFIIDDLTVSFPAFSGLLTFYRDAPIGADQVQETFLANLFVAVTQEADQMIHVLRTKCILSHLYLKHGNEVKALEECEGIKNIYDHDTHSLELVNTYGMDWSLICIATMASTYLYRGQFAAARRNIDFVKVQMVNLDEFASSTKAMSKGTVSSFYLLLYEHEIAAEVASGINATQYGYFFKPLGTLQEELANRELALHQHKAFNGTACGPDLLSVLSSPEGVHSVNQNRLMLNSSAETLSDRGIESVLAALCATEIRNLELQPSRNTDVVRKQVRYCQAGLIYLRQSLGQKDANNHERRKNYMMCLYQQAHLLYCHNKLLQLLQDTNSSDEAEYPSQVAAEDVLGIKGTELEAARKSIDECKELSVTYDYLYMQLLVGKSCTKFGFDIAGGEALIQRALGCINSSSDRDVAMSILTRMDNMQVGSTRSCLVLKPSCPRGVPSAA